MRRLLFLLTTALLTASPASAQVGIRWDVAPPSGSLFVRTSADGTVTVGGNEAVARLSADGATLWSRSIAPGTVKAMALGPDGAAYVLLQVESGAPTYGDVGVARLDPDGTVAWRRQYDGANGGSVNREYDRVTDLAVDGQGNVFTTGTDGSNDNAAMTWSLMHAADGTLLWSRTYDYLAGGFGLPKPKRAGVDCAGNVYVMGELAQMTSNDDGIPAFLISYAPDGTLRQQAIRAAPSGGSIGSSTEYFHDLAVACDGTAYVAGVEQVFRNAPDVSTQTAFVLRFDVGSPTPAWTATPFGDQSGAALSTTGGHVNLALGGPDAVYAQAATTASATSTGHVVTVRLRADGTQTWSDAGPVGASLHSKRIAADAAGVVVAAYNRPSAGVNGTLYRHLAPDGVETWSVQRIHGSVNENTPRPEANTLATVPGGGAVWTETFGHVLRVGEPPTPPTQVQLIHGIAALASIGPFEVYINQPATSTTHDAVIGYQGGTTFVDVEPGQTLSIRVRFATEVSPPVRREYTLTAPQLSSGRYVVYVAGVPDEMVDLFEGPPNGSGPSVLQAIAEFLESVPTDPQPRSGGVPVVVVNTVTDAPAVDVVVAETGQILADDVRFGEDSPPTTLPAGTHRVEVRDAATGALLTAVRFVLDGTETAFPLLITGFLDPAANQNGPALALTATDETGAAVPGVNVTGTDEGPAAGLTLAVANPARGGSSVRFETAEAGLVRLSIVDVLGREVAVLTDGERAAGAHVASLPQALTPGTYVLRLVSAGTPTSRRVTVVR